MKKVQHSKKHKSHVDKPFCNYLHRYCTQPCLDGYKYCIRHILEDKNAPFRQCSYVQQENHKRCTNAAPKNDKRDSLCPWHIKQTQLIKTSPVKIYDPMSLPNLLSQLENYCEDENHDKGYDLDEDMTERYDSLPTGSALPDLAYFGSTNEDHKTLLDQAWLYHSDESESDLDEKDFDDPLRYASVFTYEEVARIYRDKLIRLQSLYIDQFKWLQQKLQEKRRNYIQALKNEKKTLGSIYKTSRNMEEEITYQKLRSMVRYHQRYGAEALLHDKFLEKHQEKSKKLNLNQEKFQFCTFKNDAKKCTKKALPLTKFCFHHILSDPQQVLFKRCTDCSRPVVPYGENKACILHSRCITTNKKRHEVKKVPVTVSHCNTATVVDIINSEEHFQSMDDIASLGLDAVGPGSLFGLNQFGEPGESTDSALSEVHGGLMRIQPINLGTSDILCDTRKSLETGSVK